MIVRFSHWHLLSTAEIAEKGIYTVWAERVCKFPAVSRSARQSKRPSGTGAFSFGSFSLGKQRKWTIVQLFRQTGRTYPNPPPDVVGLCITKGLPAPGRIPEILVSILPGRIIVRRSPAGIPSFFFFGHHPLLSWWWPYFIPSPSPHTFFLTFQPAELKGAPWS